MDGLVPLSQSKQALLACPHSYVEQIIRGNKGPSSEASRRGTAVHSFLKLYVDHLVKNRAEKDPEWFDANLKGLGPDALAILSDLRDQFAIDPEKILATERYIALDENFAPCGRGESPEYEMTLDLITVEDDDTAIIDDYKSNFQAFEADTFQGKLYSLGVFAIMPHLESVTFRLQFVRWNRDKAVTYTRGDIEGLQAEAQTWRFFQKQITAAAMNTPAPAYPGSHCVYCPLLAAGCPIEKNPYTDPVGQLRNVLYFRQAAKRAEEAVRANADKLGTVVAIDGIGTEYGAYWDVREKRHFDINALPTILEWQRAQGDQIIPKLNLSGLSALLKAKKRKPLLDSLANFVEIESESIFRIGKTRAGEQDEGEE